MAGTPQSVGALGAKLQELDGQPFKAYGELLNRTYCHPTFRICFVHIQGSPGAFPASVGHLTMGQTELGLHPGCLSDDARRMGAADYLLRAFHQGVSAYTRRNRGVRGSGSYQPLCLPPEVLERNLVRFDAEQVRIASFPRIRLS